MRTKQVIHRFWEIDLLRGVAIIFMVVYHVLFILFFAGYGISIDSLWANLIARVAQILFISLVGVSLYISYMRNVGKLTSKQLTWKYFKRGGIVFSWGLLLTGFTLIFFPDYVIWFGILQLIGVSIILGYYCLRYKIWNLILGIIFILLGIGFGNLITANNYGYIFGIWSHNVASFDYFPLFPWFGVVLIGICVGAKYYTNNCRQFKLIDQSSKKSVQVLVYLGQHSLFIYLVHVPIIVLILMLIKVIFGMI